MTTSKIFILFLLLTLAFPIYADTDEGFPGRAKFPHIPYITLEDFHRGYANNDYVVVDARSHFEYDVIHIKNAINLSVNSDDFFVKINELAKSTPKTIVFYCNGRRCMKSYKAADKSKLSNIFVYDAGVFDWSKAYPDEAVLLGKSPMDPNDLIPSSQFKEHFISLSQFEPLILDSVLIDIRHLKERRGNGLFLLADKSVPLDNTKKLERYLNKAIKEDKILLAYDDSGKEVRWLQYYLEEKGIKKYYFMEGGAKYYSYHEPR